jgi:hypothetical protein
LDAEVTGSLKAFEIFAPQPLADEVPHPMQLPPVCDPANSVWITDFVESIAKVLPHTLREWVPQIVPHFLELLHSNIKENLQSHGSVPGLVEWRPPNEGRRVAASNSGRRRDGHGSRSAAQSDRERRSR